jgi:UDP-N-acetyl-2-amino-2-deoxyglucuronate dehydrogenase
VGVAELREDRRMAIASQYGVEAFENAASLLSETMPEIACILTPASSHRAVTEQCAAAGVHVLCEKPMAVSLEDAYAMSLACETAGTAFFYGSAYRFLPALIQARDLIARGAIGEVRLMMESIIGGQGARAFAALAPTHYPEGGPGGGGHGLVDHGIHLIDVLPWLCGSQITMAFGRGDRTGQAAQPELALLQLDSGALGILVYDGSTWPMELGWEGAYSGAKEWAEHRGWIGDVGKWEQSPGSMRVYGSEGSLRIQHYVNKLFLSDKTGTREIPLSGATTPWHFGRQLEAFIECLEAGTPPQISSADGIRALTVLHAIYASAASGTWQPITSSTHKHSQWSL